jgi:hypothetical protein
MDAPQRAKLGRISVLIAVAAMLLVAAVLVCAMRGIAAKVMGYDFLVYSALAAGALGFVGACVAFVALMKRESRLPIAYVGLALNLVLVVVGSCFTILI